VKVTADGPELNVTLLSSFPLRLEPANVIVWADAALNRTVPLPGFHDAEVLAFVHDPEIVHVSEPKEMYEVAAVTLTLPEMVTLPEVEVRAPPERVRLAAERVAVDLANVPPEIVRALDAVRLEPAVIVPAVTVTA